MDASRKAKLVALLYALAAVCWAAGAMIGDRPVLYAFTVVFGLLGLSSLRKARQPSAH